MSVRSFDMTVTTFGPRALATALVMRKRRNSEIVVRFMEPLSFGWRMRDQVPARERRHLVVNVDLIEVDAIGLQVAQALLASRLDVDAARAAIVVAPASSTSWSITGRFLPREGEFTIEADDDPLLSRWHYARPKVATI
jgi:hypothetical protein